MQQDGYVQDVKCVDYDNGYIMEESCQTQDMRQGSCIKAGILCHMDNGKN